MSDRGSGAALGAAAAAMVIVGLAGQALAFPKPKYPIDLPSSSPAPAPQPAAPPAQPRPQPQSQVQASSMRPLAPAPKGAPDALVYTVVRGDTLTGVGRRFTVGVARLAELNGIDPAAGLPAGTKLRLPPGSHDGGKDPYAQGPVSTPSVAANDRVSATSAPPARLSQVSSAPVAVGSHQPVTGLRPAIPPPASASPAPATVAGASNPTDLAQLGRGRFVWPVKGDILSPYNASRTELGNDGLNIEAAAGTEVRASANGYVIYAGEYPGFGNLVLLKHSDGWVTTYGHLQSIDVHMKDYVEQGQEIGRVGQTGGVPVPQLHFEIRYSPTPKEKARPVDPDLLLPH